MGHPIELQQNGAFFLSAAYVCAALGEWEFWQMRTARAALSVEAGFR